jgi:hypothetical protein
MEKVSPLSVIFNKLVFLKEIGEGHFFIDLNDVMTILRMSLKIRTTKYLVFKKLNSYHSIVGSRGGNR